MWTSKLAVNGKEQTLVALGEKPSVLFPACHCVVGTWKLGKNGETSAGFSGKLVDVAFNYKPTGKAPTSLTLMIRKTRDVMGVHKDYRAALHGILMTRDSEVLIHPIDVNLWESVDGQAVTIRSPLDPKKYGVAPLAHL